jgi:hypothetical protein
VAGIVHHIKPDAGQHKTQKSAKGDSNGGREMNQKQEQIKSNSRWNQDGCFDVQFPITGLAYVVAGKILINRLFEFLMK